MPLFFPPCEAVPETLLPQHPYRWRLRLVPSSGRWPCEDAMVSSPTWLARSGTVTSGSVTSGSVQGWTTGTNKYCEHIQDTRMVSTVPLKTLITEDFNSFLRTLQKWAGHTVTHICNPSTWRLRQEYWVIQWAPGQHEFQSKTASENKTESGNNDTKNVFKAKGNIWRINSNVSFTVTNFKNKHYHFQLQCTYNFNKCTHLVYSGITQVENCTNPTGTAWQVNVESMLTDFIHSFIWWHGGLYPGNAELCP